MTHPKKIRATYKNGVIEPLDKINLPEGQALEVEIKTLPSANFELSLDQKRALIEKTRGSIEKAHGEVTLKKLMRTSSQKELMGSRILDFRSADSQTVSVLLDTAVLIYYHEEVEPYCLLAGEIFNDIVDGNIRGFLSAISVTELWLTACGWKSIRG